MRGSGDVIRVIIGNQYRIAIITTDYHRSQFGEGSI
jgi:hypothetical protein